jgi:hypothetical protein
MGPQYGICFTSPFWNFEMVSTFFENLCSPRLTPSTGLLRTCEQWLMHLSIRACKSLSRNCFMLRYVPARWCKNNSEANRSPWGLNRQFIPQSPPSMIKMFHPSRNDTIRGIYSYYYIVTNWDTKYGTNNNNNNTQTTHSVHLPCFLFTYTFLTLRSLRPESVITDLQIFFPPPVSDRLMAALLLWIFLPPQESKNVRTHYQKCRIFITWQNPRHLARCLQHKNAGSPPKNWAEKNP